MGIMQPVVGLQPASACNTSKALQGMINAGLESDPLKQMELFGRRTNSHQRFSFGYLKDQGEVKVAWAVDYAPTKMVGRWYGFDRPGVAVYKDGGWHWVYLESWPKVLKTLIEDFNKQ